MLRTVLLKYYSPTLKNRSGKMDPGLFNIFR